MWVTNVLFIFFLLFMHRLKARKRRRRRRRAQLLQLAVTGIGRPFERMSLMHSFKARGRGGGEEEAGCSITSTCSLRHVDRLKANGRSVPPRQSHRIDNNMRAISIIQMIPSVALWKYNKLIKHFFEQKIEMNTAALKLLNKKSIKVQYDQQFW